MDQRHSICPSATSSTAKCDEKKPCPCADERPAKHLVQAVNPRFELQNQSSAAGREEAVRDAPALISMLIEHAVAVFDVDPNISRRYLFRAAAILRAAGSISEKSTGKDERPTGGLTTWQVNRLVEHVEQRLHERILVRDMANQVNLSPGHLTRLFSISFGVTPRRFIAVRRIEFACRLLQTTPQSIARVAIASGHNDQSHFCRVFRRLTGVTPSTWRRANAFDTDLVSDGSEKGYLIK